MTSRETAVVDISFPGTAQLVQVLSVAIFGSSVAVLSKAVVVLTTTAARTAVMPVSALNCAKRAFVTVLLSVASTYSVKVKVNRDSKDKDLLGTYRQVVKKAHPDKGGDTAKFQRLQAAKEAWAAELEEEMQMMRFQWGEPEDEKFS